MSSSRRPRITQETFDSAVRENVEDLEMPPAEAVEEAVQQFEAQGVDLRGIVKAYRGGAGADGGEEGEEEGHVARAARFIREMKEGKQEEEKAAERRAETLRGLLRLLEEECGSEKERVEVRDAVFAAGGMGLLRDALRPFADAEGDVQGDAQEAALVLLLDVLRHVCKGHTDCRTFFEPRGMQHLADLLRRYPENAAVSARVFALARIACTQEENNKVAFGRAKLDHLVMEMLRDRAGSVHARVVREACGALRSVTVADDPRREMSCAHDNARAFFENGCVPVLLGIVRQNLDAAASTADAATPPDAATSSAGADEDEDDPVTATELDADHGAEQEEGDDGQEATAGAADAADAAAAMPPAAPSAEEEQPQKQAQSDDPHALHHSVISAAMNAVKNVVTTDEIARSVVEHGGLDVIERVLGSVGEGQVSAVATLKAAIALMRNICADDGFKTQLCRGESLPRMLAAMQEYHADAALCEHGLATIAQMALRCVGNAQHIVAVGGIPAIFSTMRRHGNRVGLQRQGCLAVRNIVARNEHLIDQMLSFEGAEAIVRAAGRHQGSVDEAYAALRDLKCEVTLVRLNPSTGQAEVEARTNSAAAAAAGSVAGAAPGASGGNAAAAGAGQVSVAVAYDQFGGAKPNFNPVYETTNDITSRVQDAATAPGHNV